MSEANIDRLHEEIFELKQDIEEYERRLSVSNETIDIYEKLVKHVETQRDDLYQELQSNEMLINELEQQKAELIEALSDERDKLYNNLPSGDIKAWDLLIVIKNHIANIDELLRKHTEGER